MKTNFDNVFRIFHPNTMLLAGALLVVVGTAVVAATEPTTARPVGGKITPPTIDGGNGAFTGQFGDKTPDGTGVDPDVRRAHEIAGVPLDGNLTHPLCLTRTPDAEEVEFVENDLRKFRSSKGGRRSRAADTKVMLVPIVWHVIHWGDAHKESEETIEAQVDVLNSAYGGRTLAAGLAAKTSFQFETKIINYIDSAEYVSNCRGKSAAFRSRYGWRDATVINIFLCPATGYLGWAYLPWQYQQGSPYQAITIHPETLPGGSMYGLNEGDTLVHEMGHYLGLLHTFGSEGGCTEAEGDLVTDTPLESTPNYGCTARDSCPDHAGMDPTDNFMDYTMDKCMFRFSEGQVTRMLEMTEKYRSKLFASAATYTDKDGNLIAPCSGNDEESFCSGHGKMVVDKTACKCEDCQDGFFGDRCTETSSACVGHTPGSLCNSRGNPVTSGDSCICHQCANGYSGDFCQDTACDGKTRENYCNSRGSPFEIATACMCLGCEIGYSGIWCERSACAGKTRDSLCRGRGEPTMVGGDCLCQDCDGGYSGNYCERNPCDGASEAGFCNGRGFPVVSGSVCVCAACTNGYTGAQCESSPCDGKTAESHCNGHGVPQIGASSCVCSTCSEGYSGDYCEIGPCTGKDASSVCSGLGTPVVKGSQCVCKGCIAGFSGDYCEINACTGKTSKSLCNGKGTPKLTRTDGCTCVDCKDGYSGSQCETNPCQSLNAPCNGRGTPYLDGNQCKCRACDAGYSGSFCEITPCIGKSVASFCNDRGLPFVEDGECVCKYCRLGYSGMQCEISPCTGKTSENFCNGNADPYIDGNTCRCAKCTGNFVGENCDQVLSGGQCSSDSECATACKGGRCCSEKAASPDCTSCSAYDGGCNACEPSMYLFGWLDPDCRPRPLTTVNQLPMTTQPGIATQQDENLQVDIDLQLDVVPTLPAENRVQIRRAPETLYTDSTFDVAVSYTGHPKQTSLYVSLTRGNQWFGGMHIEVGQGEAGTTMFTGISMQGLPSEGTDYRISAYTTSGEIDADGAQIVLASDDVGSVLVFGTLGGVEEDSRVQGTLDGSSLSEITCQDSNPLWKDRDGDGCAAYIALEFCNADGTFGIRWQAGQTFADYAAVPGGQHAGTVCCGCGGGILFEGNSATFISPTATVQPASTRPPKGAISLDAGCPGGMGEFGPEIRGRGNTADSNLFVLETIRKVSTVQGCADLCLGFAAGFACKSFQYNADGKVCTLLDSARANYIKGSKLWSVYDRLFDCHLDMACPNSPLDNFDPAVDSSKAAAVLDNAASTWPLTASAAVSTEEECAALCIDAGIGCRGFVYIQNALGCQLFSVDPQTQSFVTPCSFLVAESDFRFRYGNKAVCSRSSTECKMTDNFKEAARICASDGARVCTAEEMQNDVTRGAGCGFDDLDLWTSDSCSSDEVVAGRLLSKGSSHNPSIQEPTCSFATGRLAGVRCCGDADPASAAISRGADVRLRRQMCTTKLTTSSTTSATMSTTTVSTTTVNACYGCRRNYSPVCGADGIEYNNPCFAQCAGMQVYVPGVCRPSLDECPLCTLKYDPVCADGVSYYSDCSAVCKGQGNDMSQFSRVIAGVCSQEEVDLAAEIRARSTKTCADFKVVPKAEGRYSAVCGLSIRQGKCIVADKGPVTFSKGESLCNDIGARLCSGDELRYDVAKSTGCALDKKLVWTRDVCGTGTNHHFVAPGSSNVAIKSNRCEDDRVEDVGHVRCCADVYDNYAIWTTKEEIVPIREDEQLLVDGNGSEQDAAIPEVEAANLTYAGFTMCTAAGLSPKSDSHPGVCGFSQIGGTCHGGEQTPFSTAKNLCTAVGARLCSVEEMLDDVTVGSGCDVEGEYIWTGDTCAGGGVFVAPGSSEFARNGIKPPKCVDPNAEEYGASVRCCEAGTPQKPAIVDEVTTTATAVVIATASPAAAVSGPVISEKSCSDLGRKPRKSLPLVCGLSKVPKCHIEKTYSYAKTEGMCRDMGARLCTARELKKNIMLGSGCKSGKAYYTWTSDPCDDPNQRTIFAGLGKFKTKLPQTCVDKTSGNTGGAVRCCADVGDEKRVAADPNPFENCECPEVGNPVCASRQTFVNPCYAACAGHSEGSQSPGECLAGRQASPSEVSDACDSSNAIYSFSSPIDGRLINSAKALIGERIFMSTIEECAAACVATGNGIVGSCSAFEFNTANGYCELKSKPSWGQGGFNAERPSWLIFDRVRYC